MTSTTPIRITCPSPDDVLTYPLAIIRGTATCASDCVYVGAPSNHAHDPPATAFPICDNAFTALYRLTPGPNLIRISQSPELTQPVTLNIFFHPPPPTPPHVRLLYLLTSDSDGTFQSPPPLPCHIRAGTARLQTAGLLIQSAAAEMMHAQNLQRRTFRLAPDVLVARLPITTAEAHTKTGRELWSIAARHFSTIPQRSDIIDLAVMSFTRMTPDGIKAHTALGGGNLALFGGGSLFTWPASLSEVPKCLLDSRDFDDGKFFDDSSFRMQYMGRRACTATTIGALLHELGHCFSLPHPCADAAKNGGGIMARGFDWLDRLFIQSDEERPFWDRGSAVRLRYHRFLQFEGEPGMRRMAASLSSPSPSPSRTPMPTPMPTPSPIPHARPAQDGNENSPPRFERDTDGGIFCHSDVGIGHVGYYRNGDNAAHEEFEEGQRPKRFRIPAVEELRKICKAEREDQIVISAIDIEGCIAETPYKDV